MTINYQEYFTKRQCAYWHEYPVAYRDINFQDKVVINVGGDCGSLCVYAILQGARKCIMYEKEKDLRVKAYDVIKEFSLNDKIEVRNEWNQEYPDADVILIDCEGCEEKLDVLQLQKYKQYCVAIHDWLKPEIRVSLSRKLYGTKFTYISDDTREIVLCHT